LQSAGKLCDERKCTHYELEFTLFAPIGAYNKTKIINPGNNTSAINPFWAATLFWTPRLTSSIRVHYLWSSRNPATGYKSGQAFHMNFAGAYEILKHFRIGVNGYLFQQFTDDNLNGCIDRLRLPCNQASGFVPKAIPDPTEWFEIGSRRRPANSVHPSHVHPALDLA
jgi:hypothetical protein